MARTALILCALVVLAVLPGGVATAQTAGETLVVGDSPDADYERIQPAVDAADPVTPSSSGRGSTASGSDWPGT